MKKIGQGGHEMQKKYDVIVVGGGTAGTMAAIAAARCRVNVLLIEKNGYLGGVMTGSNVGPMMTFHAGDVQVVQGIMGELIERLKKKGFSTGHIEDSTGFTYTVTPFDGEGLKVEEEQMLLESGGEILYHTTLADVEVEDQNIQSITVCNKKGLTKYYASCFIDATGDADLSTWAGVPFSKGREEDGSMQPVTLMLKMDHVNIEKVKEFIINHPDEFPRLNGNMEKIVRANRLSIGGFTKMFEEGKKQGLLSTEREDILFFESNTPGEVIFNTTRILGCDGTEPLDLSRAEIEGRKQNQEIALFVKKFIPGFEVARVVTTGPAIGVRGSRQIIGQYTLTAEDLIQGLVFEDTIAVGGYPVDIHSPSGSGTHVIEMPWGHQYYIPLRTLKNECIHNMVTVGRCISATFEAQAAIRVSPIIGAVGHAGGIAAALMVLEKLQSVSEVDHKLVQEKLIEQGAYLPKTKNMQMQNKNVHS